MNSQLTLVEPPAPHTIWYLNTDSVHNSSLSSPDYPSTSYIIGSNKYATRTHISRVVAAAEPLVVGVIQRNNILPDKMMLENSTRMSVHAWLKSGRFSAYLPASMWVKGSQYTWLINSVGGLCMHAADDDVPVAMFTRSRKQLVDGQIVMNPATLAVRKGADELRDEIIVAVAVLEHKRRMPEKFSTVLIATTYGGQGYHV